MVPMISVARFCAMFRISGPVEKMPSTGPAPFSWASTALAEVAGARAADDLLVGQVRVELAVVGEPHQDRADHGAEELTAEVVRDVAPVAVLDGQGDGDGRVEVGAESGEEMYTAVMTRSPTRRRWRANRRYGPWRPSA